MRSLLKPTVAVLCLGLLAGLPVAAQAPAKDQPAKEPPAKERPVAEKPPARPAGDKPAAQGAADYSGTYKVDPVHSSNFFRIKHMDLAWFYGRFNEVVGTYTLDAANPAGCKFEITLNTASVDTHNAARDEHLRSPDFFDAAQYPAIAFKSTKVSPAGPQSYQVAGELSMRGVTKPLTATVEVTGANPAIRGEFRSGIETTFTIKRSDFGVGKPVGLSDEVRITVSLEGVRQ